ncbi:MAG: DNA ligase D [Proteobacteria bacterium]|nr:DNA ligase D [Pseudomonadota bacterium]
MGLKLYKQKRDFKKTPEPKTSGKKKSPQLRFVIHKHLATRLHYDLRLEMQGVLKSWAVPKGPSLNPKDKHLAVMVEDHPYDYKDFEGVIPAGNYGAGPVIIWDEGTYDLLETANLKKGHLSFILHGHKLQGEFTLVRISKDTKDNWLLIKKNDEFASTKNILDADQSVRSGKTIPNKKNHLQKKNPKITRYAKMPAMVKPMLAYLSDQPFSRNGWFFEIKWDGYRIIAYVNNQQVKLFTRNQKDYSDLYWPVRDELSQKNLNAILDGEMVVLDASGYSHFQLLQNYQETGKGDLIYMVFDLLWLNGHDLRALPLSQRKRLLLENLPKMERVRISEHIEQDGAAFFKIAVKQGLEGIMGKDGHSSYLSGKRSSSWLKIKTSQRQEAVITGYTAPRGSRPFLGALILGIYQNNQLVYIGHTAGRMNRETLSGLKKQLDQIKQKNSAFKVAPKTNMPVTWVKPQLVCEVAFTEWTQDGHLRHPVFLGLRADKAAQKVTKEKPISVGKKPAREEKAIAIINNHRISLSHLNKIYWPQENFTKSMLIHYYRDIASVILPHLKDRAQVLNRFPNGITEASFFQKNMPKTPSWIKTKTFYSERSARKIRYIVCQDQATLIYMVNLGCIEINPWLSRIQKPEYPDFCVLDLDPEAISFEAVAITAKTIHHILDKLNIPNYCKTSGKRGMHIYIPLGARYTADQSRQFAEIIATLAHEKIPDITSLLRLPAQRQGKVYIDFLQNRPHQTVAAPYSARPIPGAFVSTPLQWHEVTKRLTPARFDITNILARVEKKGDIWADINKHQFDMEKVLEKLDSLRK